MQLKPGARLKSAVCDTEVVVIRAPDDDLDLRCGGSAMTALDDTAPSGGSPAAGMDEGTAVGKRYADEDLGIEVLCTKAGSGSLSIGEQPLPIKTARPLPSSD